jgi:hypothetical protein
MGKMEGPVSLTWSSSIAAGALFFPLDNWQQEFPESDVMVELLSRATAVGVVQTTTSGTDTLLEESPVQAGGTAGTIPSRLNTEPFIRKSKAGRRLKHKYRNTTAGAITVDGIITITPLRGKR